MGKKKTIRNVFLFKEEATEQVDPTLTAADNAIALEDIVLPDYDAQEVERGGPLSSLNSLQTIIGSKSTKMAVKTPFYGSGSIDVAPRIGDLLEACGFLETINASTSVVYTPGYENLKTGYGKLYLDGLLYEVAGCVGNLKISGKMGEPVYFESDLQGIFAVDSDTAIVDPSFGANFNTLPQMLGCTFTLDSVSTFLLREFEIDMGSQIIPRPSATIADGFAGFMVGKNKPTGKLVIEAESKATYDFLAKWEASTKVAAQITIGSVTGNKLTIDMNLNYSNIQKTDGDGTLIVEVPIMLSTTGSITNHPITLTCT